MASTNRSAVELATLLLDEFVTLYTAVKECECREFQERIPPWEREELTVSLWKRPASRPLYRLPPALARRNAKLDLEGFVIIRA